MKLSKNTDINIKFEIRDWWVGVYFNVENICNCPCGENCGAPDFSYKLLKIYICLLPCLPIIIKKRIE